MADAFLQGNGGINQLNFNVVGGSSVPSNPKENTIWINTEETVTDYVFSDQQPSDPVSGQVWIVTSYTSSAVFNALKNNYIHVKPVSAKQYISDTWVSKTAKIYQNDEWIEWVIWIYKEGVINTELTGGFERYAYKVSGSGSDSVKPTVTVGENSITITSNNDDAGIYSPLNKIDLTNINSIKIDATSVSYGSSGSYIHLAVVSERKNSYTTISHTLITDIGISALDVSSITGEYYILIGMNGNEQKKLEFTRWWME